MDDASIVIAPCEPREQAGSSPAVHPGAERIQLFAAVSMGPVRWRLLSGNNRELGRGQGVFAHADDCRLFIKELQADVGNLVSRVKRLAPSEWIWELRRGEEIIALSGHSYDRLIRCERGLTHFVDNLADARVADAILISNVRRWMRGAG